MISIGDYAEECRRLSSWQFSERHPRPFLLLSMASVEALEQVSVAQGLTVDRLMVGGSPAPGGARSPVEQLYSVIEVAPKDGSSRRVSLGCSGDCDVVLNDASISRRHAWLAWTEHGAYLEDDDSTSGTAINGDLLEPTKTTQLSPGDRISLGNVDLIFLAPPDFHQMVRILFAR